MMGLLSTITRRFRRDERGGITAEAVIVLPMLIWAYLALFVYWDVFRSMNTVQKATYNISDLISRQSEVDTRFLDGMQSILDYLIDSDQEASLRMTSIQYLADDDSYYVLWSRSPGGALPALTNASVQGYRDKIPDMPDGHSVLLVETQVSYSPAFNAGIGDQNFSQMIVTRPRFYLRICMTGGCPI